MKRLQSYLSIIEPRLLHHLTGKPKEFITLFQSHHFVSEEVFKSHVCAGRTDEKYYSNLKGRTVEILQALAIVSEFQGQKTVGKNLDLCRKKFMIAQKFISKGERIEGLRVIKQAHRLAVKYDFVHIACESSSVLYHHYTYYMRNPSKAKHYADQVDRYLQDYTAEKKAEHYLFDIIGQMNEGSRQGLPFKQALAQIEQYQGQSLKYQGYRMMLHVLYGVYQCDYEMIIRYCREALDFFKGRVGVYRSTIYFFFSYQGIAQIAMRQYHEAQASFHHAAEQSPAKSINYVLSRLHLTIAALHAGDYHRAYILMRAHRKCKFEQLREQFAIIEAYLFFLSHLGYLQLDKIFRLGKFHNETLQAKENKQGRNIAILIAELLVHLARDRGQFIDRVEAVNHYRYRHLKGEDTRRAKRFMKILCLMPRANFNPIALKRLAHKEIDYLKIHPFRMGQNIEIEILPFETLLDMILLQLERKVA